MARKAVEPNLQQAIAAAERQGSCSGIYKWCQCLKHQNARYEALKKGWAKRKAGSALVRSG